MPREYIEAVVRSGARGMPGFDIDDDELSRVVEYLTSVNASGDYSPTALSDRPFGDR